MNTNSLLFREPRDWPKQAVPNARDLICDLNLANIFSAMSRGDRFLYDAAGQLLLAKTPATPGDILYRQSILRDALENREAVRSMYRVLSARIVQYHDCYKKSQPAFSSFVTVSARIKDAVELFRILICAAVEINAVIDQQGAPFASEGMRDFIGAFRRFFSDAFIKSATAEVDKLRSTLDDSCVTYSAGLGLGLKGSGYILRGIGGKKTNGRSSGAKSSFALSSIGIQAQAGALRDAGLLKMVYVLNEANAKMLERFEAARRELGFYTGCVNLYEELEQIGVPTVFPTVPEPGQKALDFEGLSDVSLALEHSINPVGNTLHAGGAGLFVITGANQGGKSTFLRSLGCAQLMMQCGMFVAARSFRANCCSGVLTHFCRSEPGKPDRGMLEDELARMDALIALADRDSLVMLNESFSSAHEREACAIAGEVVGALHGRGVRTLYVTHLYDFTAGLAEQKPDGVMFLAAQRNADGTRPYTIAESLPERSSFGMDIYNEVFGE